MRSGWGRAPGWPPAPPRRRIVLYLWPNGTWYHPSGRMQPPGRVARIESGRAGGPHRVRPAGGAVIDAIRLTGDRPVREIVRHLGQLG
jgi:hypothetical protein